MRAKVVQSPSSSREFLNMNVLGHTNGKLKDSNHSRADSGSGTLSTMAVGGSHATSSPAWARLEGGEVTDRQSATGDFWMSKEFVTAQALPQAVSYPFSLDRETTRGDIVPNQEQLYHLGQPLHYHQRQQLLSTIENNQRAPVTTESDKQGKHLHSDNGYTTTRLFAANPSRERDTSILPFSCNVTNRAEKPVIPFATLPVNVEGTDTTNITSNITTLLREENNNSHIAREDTVKTPTVSHTPTRVLPSDDTVSREIMGYNNSVDHSLSDTIQAVKMEASSEHGETRTVTSMASETAERDDDDSTHQSGHSAVDGGSLEAIPLHGSAAPGSDMPGVPGGVSVVGTPSTVSTAPSTDDASFLALEAQFPMERSAGRLENNMFEAVKNNMVDAVNRYHERLTTWDMAHNHQQHHHHIHLKSQPQVYNGYGGTESDQHSFQNASVPSSYQQQHSPSTAWGSKQQHAQHAQLQTPMVASFRDHQAYPSMATNENRWQQPLRFGGGAVPGPVDPQPHAFYAPRPGATDNRGYRAAQQQPQIPPPQSGFGHYHVQQRKPPTGVYPVAGTPPRGAVVRGQRSMAGGTSASRVQPMPTVPNHSPAGGQRSPSEVLKTLLRKKACLYEPDTSRAVALVTWLVGRVLAMETGFFSRQQLQAGVHACVAEKIQSGVITRTKVNRCMQIILNSCFHYIIPRPDGTEENGEGFRQKFADEVKDDSFLLNMLPVPWNDVTVDKDIVIEAASTEADGRTPKKTSAFETPQSSPKLGSTPAPEKGSPSKDSAEGDDADGKRAVLLCFNENVRHAKDVFRCHNEFIRDTAHASNLQLSSHEWQLFFGREAASVPFLWGNIGIPVPHLPDQSPSQTDALGMMTKDENNVFRTTWCAKRYDHDHELCGFAHVEVNGGWLRRNPSIYNYRDEMCPHVRTVRGRNGGVFIINECPHGVDCEYAHSAEEIAYHPRRYKQKTCNANSRPGGCPLGDVCPYFHPTDLYRFPKKVESRSPRHSRQHQNANKTSTQVHSGAPMLYASPAPLSQFEKHLQLPGLQNLFRRNCAVLRAHILSDKPECTYSYFGDDVGIKAEEFIEAK